MRTSRINWWSFIFLFLLVVGGVTPACCHGAEVPDFADLFPIFNKNCVECHDSKDPEGSLAMNSHELLMKGGTSGPVVIAGRDSDSLLVKYLEGRVEKDGKVKFMPPGKRERLPTESIEKIKAWIRAGALPPAKPMQLEVRIPKIAVKGTPRRPIVSLAFASGTGLLAVGRHGEIDLLRAETRSPVRTLSGHQGDVSAMVFSTDGSRLFAASGRPGIGGEIREWNVAEGVQLRKWEGHQDALYSIALSPDGGTLAVGSYDQKISLWDVSSGRMIRTLSGHNGGVFDLAYRPDGRILASASLDRTVKLWDPATGQRRDTLSQSLKEVYAVVFSKDGKKLWTGAADNRIRTYSVSELASETTNPILDARFAHEGTLLRLALSSDGKWLASSADDRTVKIWKADDLKEQAVIERQPDWPSALVFLKDSQQIAVGRLDGTLGVYEVSTGKPAPKARPELARLFPRGSNIGAVTRVQWTGRNLDSVVRIKSNSPKISGKVLSGTTNSVQEIWVEVSVAADTEPGSVELWGEGDAGETERRAFFLDDLPQSSESSDSPRALAGNSSFWGVLEARGEIDRMTFDPNAGESWTVDVQGQAFGSKANLEASVLDERGMVLGTSQGTPGDPLFSVRIKNSGRHTLVVRDRFLAGSPEHFYRATLSSKPQVLSVFPLAISQLGQCEVELRGLNIAPGSKIKVSPGKEKMATLALDRKSYRSRGPIRVSVSSYEELLENEPNDLPEQAMPLKRHQAANGHLEIQSNRSGSDVDYFSFEAVEGESVLVETVASQAGSKADTRLDILWPDGKPVARLLLQAVRNTSINFRPIGSTANGARLDNYEEMELDDYLYFKGDVMRLIRMPQGPDSDTLFYSLNGKRRTYFDTTAVSHALEEPGYIVVPMPLSAKPAANGLPAFTLNYSNDDDGERKLGTDSRLFFKAPRSGRYFVKVSESRGASGSELSYRLLVREPRPDFKLTLASDKLSVPRGSGQAFTYNVERFDGFDGDITIQMDPVSPGVRISSPLIIQAGHQSASGVVHVAEDCKLPGGTNVFAFGAIASAKINGTSYEKAVAGIQRIEIVSPPKLRIRLDATGTSPGSDEMPVLIIQPGTTIPAHLNVSRQGHEELITFNVENLPHGVIVDNIGLNGVLMPKGENQREIFITAARWVSDQDRLCYAVENQAGRQTSVPVMLKVRRERESNKTATAAGAATQGF